MTSPTSLNTAPTEPADAAEPADADGSGETVIDDPADADAPGSGATGAAGTSADAGGRGNGYAGDSDTGTDVEAPGASEDQVAGKWVRVCRLDELTPDRGRAALVDGQQVALFRLSSDVAVYAIGNRDPFSGAYVLSRGVVGDKGGVPKVASPVFKQGFDLRNGQCLDDPDVTVPAYRVRVDDGWVLVEVPPGTGP